MEVSDVQTERCFGEDVIACTPCHADQLHPCLLHSWIARNYCFFAMSDGKLG